MKDPVEEKRQSANYTTQSYYPVHAVLESVFSKAKFDAGAQAKKNFCPICHAFEKQVGTFSIV